MGSRQWTSSLLKPLLQGSAGGPRSPAPRRRSALPELDVAGMADHPLHAEAVDADAEFLGPFDLLQRHLDAAAVRQAGYHAVGFIGAVGFHRDVCVGADLAVAGTGYGRGPQTLEDR